jgi:hypothetical protein
MSQVAKIIDITRTFVPSDPLYFPNTLHATQLEDKPEEVSPVAAYEGYNFLPTSYGYKSYFGTNAVFDIPVIPDTKVDRVFVFEKSDYTHFFVAITSTGIFTNTGKSAAAWVQAVVLAAPALGTQLKWTVAVINNTLYSYREGHTHYHTISTAGVVTNVAPSFLNMAGQRGIFKAGGRLGFWDSENSVAWSSFDDHSDFTPSVVTLAGSAVFNDVTGKIVTILSAGDGFIIYATKSVVLVQRDLSSTFQWNPLVLLAGAGIAYPNQAIAASPDTKQFAYTSIGLHKIEGAKTSPEITEVTDLLRESLYPVALKMLENRYLAFQLIESKFVEGLVQLTSYTHKEGIYTFPIMSIVNASTLTNTQLAQMLSFGAFIEQQDMAKDAFVAAGVKDRDEYKPAIPIWEYAYNNRKQIVFNENGYPNVTLITVNGSYVLGTSVEPMLLETTYTPDLPPYTVANSAPSTILDSAYPCSWLVNSTEGEIVLGIEEGNSATVFQFIVNQKAYWDNSATEHRNYLYAVDQGVKAIKFHPDNSPGTNGVLTFSSPMGDDIITGTTADPNYPTSGTINQKSSYFIALHGGTLETRPRNQYKMVMLTEHQQASFTYNACSVVGRIQFDKAAVRQFSSARDHLSYSLSTTDAELDFRQDSVSELPSLSLSEPLILTSRAYIKQWKYTALDGTTKIVDATVCADTTVGTFQEVGDPSTDPIELVPAPNNPYPWRTDPLDTPEVTITLQDGSPGPVYPTYAGALVYDLELKKWGKMKCQYTELLDLSPINTNQGNIVNTKRFGINAAAVLPTATINRFDTRPAASYIKYGKIGFYRQGFTDVEEVRVHMRTPSTGTIVVEASLDGKNIETGFTDTTTFTDATHVIAYPNLSGRWQNVSITGNFDIMHLEYRGRKTARR